MDDRFQRGQRYRDRAIRPAGVLDNARWRLKRYDIAIDGELRDHAFEPGVARALAALPQPAVTPARPGVGVLIRHLGVDAGGGDAHYVVLLWWDNRNELISRVFVRDRDEPARWIDGEGRYSFCVWDLEVMWREREAYVRYVLSPPAGPDVEAYLRANH